jgi:hypothetical protein
LIDSREVVTLATERLAVDMKSRSSSPTMACVPVRHKANAGNDRPRSAAAPRQAGIMIPTIVITAHDGLGTRERCRSAGAVDYLLKPLQEAPLIAINAATEAPARRTKRSELIGRFDTRRCRSPASATSALGLGGVKTRWWCLTDRDLARLAGCCHLGHFYLQQGP